MLSDGNILPAPFKHIAGAAQSALRRVLDLALPPLCAACREPVEGRGLCPACWSKLSFITRPHCERLGTPFVYDPGPGILSMEAIADPPAYNRAAPRCVSMRFRGCWCTHSNMAIGLILHQ